MNLKCTVFIIDMTSLLPREDRSPRQLASATNLVLGTFMLWWGWLGLNCGSTLGVSGGKWKLASRTAVVTINGSVGGGIWSILYCYCLTKDYERKLDIPNFTQCILGGLVSITAVCAVCRPWEAFLIGFIGGMTCSYGSKLLTLLHVDDPVSCIPVHGMCGALGLVVVGLTGLKETEEGVALHSGVFKGGPWSYLGFQMLSCVAIASWAAVTTFVELFLINKMLGLRMSAENESLGADFVEHGIGPDDQQPPEFGTMISHDSNTSRRSRYTKRRTSSVPHCSFHGHCGNVENISDEHDHNMCDVDWLGSNTLEHRDVVDLRSAETNSQVQVRQSSSLRRHAGSPLVRSSLCVAGGDIPKLPKNTSEDRSGPVSSVGMRRRQDATCPPVDMAEEHVVPNLSQSGLSTTQNL